MDFPPSRASYLARTWVIEALACSNQVDVSLLLELLERTPEITEDFGRNARESVSLRILESILAKARNVNPVPCNTNPKISLHPSELCEDVLRRILTETHASSINRSEILKWDLGPFIEHKRSSLAKYALQQLKYAIRSGKHSSVASFREQSGLSVGKYSNITGRPHESARDGSKVSGMEQPDESFIPVSRKRSAAEAIDSEKSCRNQIRSRNVDETNIGSSKKQKHNLLDHEQNVVGQLNSSDIKLVVASKILVQNNRRLKRSLEKPHDLGLNEPAVTDNEHTSSRAAVGVDELLPRADQVYHADGELNRKCVEEHDQRHDVDKAKDGRDGFSSLNMTDKDASVSETDVRKNAENVVEAENVGISGDSYRRSDEETNIPAEIRMSDEGPCRQGSSERDHASFQKQNLHQDDEANVSNDSGDGEDDEADVVEKKKRFLSSQCTYSQDSLTATDLRDLNLCLKCKKGGKLLVCSSDSCSLVIHDNCWGSDGRFDLGGEFYCPFCVYSRAITKYMKIKKKVTSARKDLAAFISDGKGESSKKHCRSYSANDNTQEKNGNGLPKCDEPNFRNGVEKATSSLTKKDPHFAQREASLLRSDKPIGVTKQEKQHTYPQPPKPRRQLLPWTTEEEDLLMEEVKRYSAAGAIIPWTKILELGADVFQGRRPIDLKNKWRNAMRKAASK